jgi:2-C-methyl-D-erythritol 4-phosphate cytidylyltransferase
VRAALHHTLAGDPVLVHDAARPLVTPDIIRAVLAGLDADADAAIAAARVTDTIKEEAGDDSSPTVARTLDRSGLWAIQTPQVFRRDVLERALAQPHEIVAAATDDASLVETMGGTVRLVESPRENLKVTTPDDLRLADLLLRSRR